MVDTVVKFKILVNNTVVGRYFYCYIHSIEGTLWITPEAFLMKHLFSVSYIFKLSSKFLYNFTKIANKINVSDRCSPKPASTLQVVRLNQSSSLMSNNWAGRLSVKMNLTDHWCRHQWMVFRFQVCHVVYKFIVLLPYKGCFKNKVTVSKNQWRKWVRKFKQKKFICEEIINFRCNRRIDLNICWTDIQIFLFLWSTIGRLNFEKLY